MTQSNTPYEATDRAVDDLRPVIEGLANELWDIAELSLHEVESEKAVIGALDELGFTITSTGARFFGGVRSIRFDPGAKGV